MNQSRRGRRAGIDRDRLLFIVLHFTWANGGALLPQRLKGGNVDKARKEVLERGVVDHSGGTTIPEPRILPLFWMEGWGEF